MNFITRINPSLAPVTHAVLTGIIKAAQAVNPQQRTIVFNGQAYGLDDEGHVYQMGFNMNDPFENTWTDSDFGLDSEVAPLAHYTSQDCADFNERNAEAIKVGVVAALRPSGYQLEKEHRARLHAEKTQRNTAARLKFMQAITRHGAVHFKGCAAPELFTIHHEAVSRSHLGVAFERRGREDTIWFRVNFMSTKKSVCLKTNDMECISCDESVVSKASAAVTEMLDVMATAIKSAEKMAQRTQAAKAFTEANINLLKDLVGETRYFSVHSYEEVSVSACGAYFRLKGFPAMTLEQAAQHAALLTAHREAVNAAYATIKSANAHVPAF